MQKFGSLTLYTNDELIEKAKREQQDRLKNGLRDGDFRIFFRKKDLSIQIERDGQEWHSIELKDCTTPKELLGIILHIHGKTWGSSSSVIASILTILDDA